MRNHLKTALDSETGDIPMFPLMPNSKRTGDYLATQNVKLYCVCKMPFAEDDDDPDM